MIEFDWVKLQNALQFYQREKLRHFPLVWGAKKPTIAWKPLQDRPPTFAEMAEWFQEGKPVNVAIICGGASNGLVALCFNDSEGAVEFFGKELWDKLLTSTFIVKTPRGVHVYLRSKTLIKSQFVTKGSNLSWLEIRADGNYIAAPPSLHPSGSLYEPIGVESIAMPKNLAAYIEQRLSHLGLRSREHQEPPEAKNSKGNDVPAGEQTAEFNEVAIGKLTESCAFIQYCQGNAATLSEPYWWSMVHNLVVFGQSGIEKIHELSAPYPKYTEAETEQKIEDAKRAVGKSVSPHSCAFIARDLGFACPEDCLALEMDIKSPAGLAFRLTTQEQYGNYLYRDKAGWRLDINKLVADLLAEYSFKTARDNEECLIYSDGVYLSMGESVIKEECETRVPRKFITNHNVSEIIGHVKRSTYIDRHEFNKEKWVLNLKNGLYDIHTKKLNPHTPDFLSTIRIPINYDQDAECVTIHRFFSEILKNGDVPIIEELFGYCLVPDYTIQHAFLFTGDGANGKSTLIELLKHFIGKDNCTSYSLQSIENQRFIVAGLFGKLANLYADIPSTPMRHVGIFKMLTGGDTIGAEKKFKDGFSFNSYAKLVFSSNKPPKVEEDTLAFWRRWLMVDFPNKFEDEKADAAILSKLTHKNELSGLLNIALVALKRLLDKQHYSHEQSPNEIAERYQKASDSIFAFIEDRCTIDSEGWVSKDSLYTAFIGYCDTENIPLIGKEAFGRQLKNTTAVNVSSQRSGARGSQLHGWKGMSLSSEIIDMEV